MKEKTHKIKKRLCAGFIVYAVVILLIVFMSYAWNIEAIAGELTLSEALLLLLIWLIPAFSLFILFDTWLIKIDNIEMMEKIEETQKLCEEIRKEIKQNKKENEENGEEK